MSLNTDGEFMLKDKRNYALFKNIENVSLIVYFQKNGSLSTEYHFVIFQY